MTHHAVFRDVQSWVAWFPSISRSGSFFGKKCSHKLGLFLLMVNGKPFIWQPLFDPWNGQVWIMFGFVSVGKIKKTEKEKVVTNWLGFPVSFFPSSNSMNVGLVEIRHNENRWNRLIIMLKLILDDFSRYVQRSHNLRPGFIAPYNYIPYSSIVGVEQSLQGIQCIVNLKWDELPGYGMGHFVPYIGPKRKYTQNHTSSTH